MGNTDIIQTRKGVMPMKKKKPIDGKDLITSTVAGFISGLAILLIEKIFFQKIRRGESLPLSTKKISQSERKVKRQKNDKRYNTNNGCSNSNSCSRSNLQKKKINYLTIYRNGIQYKKRRERKTSIWKLKQYLEYVSYAQAQQFYF